MRPGSAPPVHRSLSTELATILALDPTLLSNEAFLTGYPERLRHLAATFRLSTPLLVALAAWAVLAPLAGWVAIRQK